MRPVLKLTNFVIVTLYTLFSFPLLSFYSSLPVTAQITKANRSEGLRLWKLGTQQSQASQFEAALQSFQQALAIFQSTKNNPIISILKNTITQQIGSTYISLSNYSKAIEYYQQSLTSARERKDLVGEGRSLAGLGISYANLGDYKKSIEYYEQHLVIAREVEKIAAQKNSVGDFGLDYPQGEGLALSNLGKAHHALGNYAKAITYYEQFLARTRERRDQRGEVAALGTLGDLYREMENYTKAMDYHKQSLTSARKIMDRKMEGFALGNLGVSYLYLGDAATAISLWEQGLVTLRENKDRAGEVTILRNVGIAYFSLGNYRKAIEFQKKLLAIAREIKDRAGEQRALNDLSALLAEQEPELAITILKQSVNVGESIRQDIRKLPRETQEIYISSVAKTYRYLADFLLMQGRIYEARSILELLKVQELQDHGKDQEPKSAPIQFPIHPLETQALTAIEKTIASQQPLTLATLTTIGQPLTQNRDRITQEMNNSPIAIGNPQALLNANPNAILIQNLVVNDKLWVLWTNAKGQTKATLIPNLTQAQLDRTVQSFRDQIGSPYSNLNDLKTTSTQLYNWLIPPQLQTELTQNPRQHLIFSLDHVTRYIPVAALYDGNQYLAQRYTLSNIITTDSDTTDRLTRPNQPPNILALGTSKGYRDFAPLPNVEAELNAIVQDGKTPGIYPGKIQLNEAFTAKSLTTNLDAYRVLHIATHGEFNPKTITASYLLLGNGDHLPITDIANLNTLNSTHLVVLSACQTGISGAGQDGTEISGISGYFLRRGAKSVLASLWSVNDASTALLMQQFYHNLSQSKLTKAQALQKVQQEFISGKFTANEAKTLARANVRADIPGQLPANSFAHPYYWAPFILSGNSL